MGKTGTWPQEFETRNGRRAFGMKRSLSPSVFFSSPLHFFHDFYQDFSAPSDFYQDFSAKLAPSFHSILLSQSHHNDIMVTITNLLCVLLHRAASAIKCHPFQYPPRWENVINPIGLDLCHWTTKLYGGVSSADQSYEKWNHLLETVSSGPWTIWLRISKISPCR